MSENNVPKHIQRLRSMEQRYIRESKEAEIRLQNDADYIKTNAIPLTVRAVSTEVVNQVSEHSPVLGRILGKTLVGETPSKRLNTPLDHDFRPVAERTRPTLRESGIPSLGFKSVMEEYLIPVSIGFLRGKLLSMGLRGTSKLIGTVARTIRRAI